MSKGTETMRTEAYAVGFGKPPQGWPKGTSGNPGGKPRGAPRVSNGILRILKCAPDEIFKPQNQADVLALRLFESAQQGDTWATREILDRTEGKVSQSLAITAQQLPTSEIVEKLVEAFAQVGVDELQTRKVLLMLAEGTDD